MSKEVVLLPGDGIGPEIMTQTVRVLNAVTDKLEFEEYPFGGASIEEYGEPLTDETLEACRQSDAVLFGAAGGLQWGKALDSPKPERGLLHLRKALGLYANLRPIQPYPALYDTSPLREERITGTDLLIIRELTGGIYFGEKNQTQNMASDECVYTRQEIERIARVAFQAADHKVTSVDKANVLATSKLWREVVQEVGKQYEIELEHLLVDNAAMQLIADPARFDVILTENMFGDILSDEAATLTGSIGLLPSASLGDSGKPGLFEPVHGSAPDIAGQGIANPLAMFLSGALMLRHGLSMPDEATAIEAAVESAIHDGLRTHDLNGAASTLEACDAVLAQL